MLYLLDSAAPSEPFSNIDDIEIIYIAIIVALVIAITTLIIIKLVNKKKENKK